jgi:L-fuconolactonase
MTRAMIDAHQHFWDPHRYSYPWMARPELQALCRPFLPNDLAPILQDAGVAQTVLVQAQSSLDETYWFLDLAKANAFIGGVVGWVDLTASDLPEVLDQLSQHSAFKGVRHQAEEESDDAWLNRPDVLHGLKEIARRGLSYDLLVKPRHLRSVPAIARHVPDLRMVVDHIAKPSIVSGQWETWAEDLAAVARLPNVWCKLSGMMTEADWKHWRLTDFRPYVDHVVRQFGFDRVMFGSDWPVCLLAGTYPQAVEAVIKNLGGISESQRDRIFGENARVFYRLR